MRQPSTAKGVSGDTFGEAINTSKGVAIEALFALTLKKARLATAQNRDRAVEWNTMRSLFDVELEKCRNGNFEFSSIAGAYIPNLLFLDKSWVFENVNSIFSKEYDRNWHCAMEGYAYVTTVSDELFLLLRREGHLVKALHTDFKSDHVREKILQQITVAYLRGLENLSEPASLVRLILDRFNPADVHDIVWFLWTIRDGNLPPPMIERLFTLWQWCSERIRGREEEYSATLSDLSLLATYVDSIGDREKTLLLQAAPYVDEKHHSPLFIEALDRLAAAAPQACAECFLAVLERTFPTFNEKDIRSVVEKLYQAGLKDSANQIVNKYELRRIHMLRDIYDRHNPK